MSGSLRADFLGRCGERIFALLHLPELASRPGCVLIVPPFAEEMNKSRRMMAQLARALAAQGVAAACVDLYGTGDSEGEFEHATWERWASDVGLAATWCERVGHPVAHVVGIRLGCALAMEACKRLGRAMHGSVFWQPVTDGARVLEQFLRLRVAASMMDQDKKETVKELRERLRNGATLEIAGYQLSGALATAVDGVSLAALASAADMGEVHWMEVVRETKPPTAPTANAMEALRARGRAVNYHQITGEPFWSATEIVSLPELIGRTAEVLCATPAALETI